MTYRARNILPIVAIAVGYLFLASQTSPAMPAPCIGESDFINKVVGKYQETPSATGITAAGELMTLYSNDRTKTWTVAVSYHGVVCMLSVGQFFTKEVQGDPL